ncbi:MAG: 6-phosphogluconolactonase, partial [Chloroflexaceae bacterium]|nr:6-phosphogluconolactonase [Chloroflexaceae bacterium]
MTNQPDIRILPDKAALAAAAADYVSTMAADCIQQKGRFVLVLTGGSTPGGVYRLLAQEPHRSRIAWDNLYILWDDERFVPADHPDNNSRMACE